MIASRLSLYLAIALYVSSLCLPAVDGAFGAQIVFAAILGHILLIGIPFAFPAWANVLFYLAVKKYFQHEKQPDAEVFHSGLVWSIVGFMLMIIGILIGLTKGIQIGALLWLLSGIFLVFAFIFQKMPAWLGGTIFLLTLTLSVILIAKTFNEAVDIEQYQSQSSSKHASTLFDKKTTDLPVPKLTQVVQNHPTRNKGTGHPPPPIDRNAVDLSVLKDQRIEVQFAQMVPTSLYGTSETVCQMGLQQQYFIHYPKMFWENGYEWQHLYSNWELELAVGRLKENDTSILYRSTRLDDRHTRLELINKNNQQILYTQDLLIQPFKNGCLYLPAFYEAELESAFQLLKDEKLPHEQHYALIDAKPRYEETLDTTCQWEKIHANEYKFENKKIRIVTDKSLNPRFLCSEHYIAVAFMSRVANQYISTGDMKVTLLSRENFEQVSCDQYKLELNKNQQLAYEKGEFHLARIETQRPQVGDHCAPYKFYFTDGTMQEKKR